MQGVEMQERADTCYRFYYERYKRTEDIGDKDTYDAAAETYDCGLGNKHVANIALACADCAQNTYLTDTLDDGVGRDDTDHDGGYHK